MGRTGCAVPNCQPSKMAARYRFPHPKFGKDRMLTWLRIINNEKLKTLDFNVIYKNYSVCDKHFMEEDRTTNNRLKNMEFSQLSSKNILIATYFEDGNKDMRNSIELKKMAEETRGDLLHHCKYYVIRKKRFCKMTVKVGEEYCGEHQKLSPNLDTTELDRDKTSKIRIICPLDRKHTCYVHNLKKHLKICNAGRIPLEPYIVKGINSGKGSGNIIDSYKLLSTFSVYDIKEVISRVNEIFEKYVKDKVSEKLLSHELVEEEMAKPEYGDKTKKHLKQVSSILGFLNEYKMLAKARTCYIEFGAGRGQLSYWIANAVKSVEGSTVLLVERASPKHKRDNKLDKNSYKVQRVRVDISDLLLDKLEIVGGSENIVAVTKHLCGEATDLAVRCLANVKENKHKLQGAVLTFCCHHRCRWTPYVGREFFEEHKLSENDFYIMCGMASWATCGTGFSRERRKNLQDTEEITPNERDSELGLSREEKEVVGQRSKHILNWGRLYYLEKLGFNCFLHYYVNKSVSLENVCIVAYR